MQTTNETQLFCADRLFQRPALMIDSTVIEIGNWIDSSSTAPTMSGLCPQWIASSNSVVNVGCSRASPYICSMGKIISSSCCYYAYFKYFLIKVSNGFEITCLTFRPPKIHFADEELRRKTRYIHFGKFSGEVKIPHDFNFSPIGCFISLIPWV